MLAFFSRMIRIFLVLTLLGMTVVAAGAAIGPQIAELKGAVQGDAFGDISLAALDIRSEVFDRDGNLIYRFSTDGSNRELLTLADMPEQVVTAVLTIEDEDFMRHPGLNLRATFRALIENVGAGGISQGGSTITQQLVKNRVLRTDEQTVERKVREAVVSWRLEQELSKEEILEWYLNTVYFGSGAYGVQAAAEVYFGKNAADLDWPEAAMLAALISSPADYDPFLNPVEAQRQRQIVFNRLVEVGAIDEEQARFYNRVPLPNSRNELVDIPPEDFFVAEVRRGFLDGEIPADPSPTLLSVIGEDRESRIDALFRGGLRIYTTYDRPAQAEALKARDQVLPADGRGFTMALAALEPSTGAVRALVGGDDFDQEKEAFNLATQGDRQPGSSFKTFVLVAALEAGYVPNDTISGIGPCQFENPGGAEELYTVTNFGNSGGSVNTLTNQATASSNCAFVRLGQAVGIPSVIETANRMGLELDPVVDNNKSLPLGATEVRPLEMVSAYATIANGGVRHEPYYIERIEDALGNVLYTNQVAGTRVLGTDIACLATQVLEQNVIRGTGTRAQIPDQPAAGKTGTTEKFSDAWFVGFTPQLATAVWMGHPDGRTAMENVGGRNVTGGSYPAEAWGQFMTAYHEELPREDFAVCPATRAGRYIRDDGETSAENPCAAYPGYSPTDTNNDGVVDQCIVNPASLGYVRCGAVDTGEGLLEQFCSPGLQGGAGASVQCGSGQQPLDLDANGTSDTCATNPALGDQSSLCDVGYQPVDTNGDGRADICQQVAGEPTPIPPPGSDSCPAGFPYGKDTNGDGTIDTCYASPVP